MNNLYLKLIKKSVKQLNRYVNSTMSNDNSDSQELYHILQNTLERINSIKLLLESMETSVTLQQK